MSARETLAGSPLFPLPIQDEFPEGKQRLGRGGDETMDVYGHCSWWCENQHSYEMPNGKRGNTIAEHGDDPFCAGQIGTSQAALGVHGNSTYVGVELFTTYSHGVYVAGQLGMKGSKVALTMSSDNDHCDEGIVFFEPEQVRSLAATLLRAADHLEGLAPQKR